MRAALLVACARPGRALRTHWEPPKVMPRHPSNMRAIDVPGAPGRSAATAPAGARGEHLGRAERPRRTRPHPPRPTGAVPATYIRTSLCSVGGLPRGILLSAHLTFHHPPPRRPAHRSESTPPLPGPRPSVMTPTLRGIISKLGNFGRFARRAQNRYLEMQPLQAHPRPPHPSWMSKWLNRDQRRVKSARER